MPASWLFTHLTHLISDFASRVVLIAQFLAESVSDAMLEVAKKEGIPGTVWLSPSVDEEIELEGVSVFNPFTNIPPPLITGAHCHTNLDWLQLHGLCGRWKHTLEWLCGESRRIDSHAVGIVVQGMRENSDRFSSRAPVF